MCLTIIVGFAMVPRKEYYYVEFRFAKWNKARSAKWRYMT